ncbi:MAG: hypothetical protein HeimC2_07470 [Candidatus Heimdallarchaeota archaeon LC_2]|nr:MAG: hypothetical protein HeimC2_07470 [Candidatus Heimdallarchaeota archaeon LC_2]
MSKEVDIEYPNYEDDVSVQFPNNPNPVKLSTPNLLIGISNLYKVLFFHILILTILLFFLYKVVQQPVQSFSLYFIYPHLNIRYSISQSLTIKYLLSWIPMIYIFMKTREYHEKNWNSSSLIPVGWDPFQREVGVTIIEDLKSRYQYIPMIIIVSLGFALFNLFIF